MKCQCATAWMGCSGTAEPNNNLCQQCEWFGCVVRSEAAAAEPLDTDEIQRYDN